MSNEDNPFNEQKPENAQGSRPADSSFTSNLGEQAFGSPSQTATVPRESTAVSPRPDRAQQVDDLIKSGADAQRDTGVLQESHPGVNMPLDKMNASQARSISDTQLQTQGVGGAGQVSFKDRNGNVETLTKSVENGQTRYYRPDGTYLEPVKHTDGSDRYEMRDSRNPTEVVRMKELPTAVTSTPTDRPPTTSGDKPPTGSQQPPTGDRALPPVSAPVVKGGDSVALSGQPQPGQGTEVRAGSDSHRGHHPPQVVPVDGGGEAALRPVKGTGNEKGTPDSFLYKDQNTGAYYRLDEGAGGTRKAVPVSEERAREHITQAASQPHADWPRHTDTPSPNPPTRVETPNPPPRVETPNPVPNPNAPRTPTVDATGATGTVRPPAVDATGATGTVRPPAVDATGATGTVRTPGVDATGATGTVRTPGVDATGATGTVRTPGAGGTEIGGGRHEGDPGRLGGHGDDRTPRVDPGRAGDAVVRQPGGVGGTGSPTDAVGGRPGRDVGVAGVGGPLDGRGIRDAAVLAQDLRLAEQKFRGSETQDARADARRDLEALRREYADAVRRDPAYGARVQDAYRTLEGRGPGGDKGPRTSDGIPPGTPIPGRDQAADATREAVRQARDAGSPASELMRISGINLAEQRSRDAMVDVLTKMQGGALKPDQLDPSSRKIYDVLNGLDPSRADQLKQFLTDLQTPGKQRPDDATIALKLKEIMDGTKDATLAKRTDAGELSGVPKTASERLMEFMKANKDVLGQGMDSERSKAAMLELNKIIKDMNKELGLDPTKGGISVKDIVGRSLMEGTVKPGEKGVERTQIGREETLVAKMNPQQEAALKAMTERGTRAELPAGQTERRPEQPATALDKRGEVPAGRAEQPVKVEGGKPETGRETAKAETARSEAATQVPQKGGAPEGRSGTDGKLADGKAEPGAKDLGGKPDAAAATRAVDVAAAAAAGAKAGDAAGQNIDPRSAQGRSDIADKLEEDKKTKKADEKEKLDEEQQRLTDAQLAILAARKAKEDKEREEKEKERAQESDKKEQDARRTKYVVKEKDTLESIAVRMLRDKRLAALILEINKTVIQIKEENGKKVADLQPKQVIWLPSPLDIKEFRGRIFGAAGDQIEYGQAQSATGKALTPEEELAAKFGGRPEDYADGRSALAGRTEPEPTDVHDDALAEMTAEAVAAAKVRRENVEKLLGPVAAPKNVDDTGNLKYTVRLGDSLKSVAIKHPALQDVQLWKLLAETNDLSSDTDAKGTPIAQLKRGTVIKVPPPHVVEEYRKEHKLKSVVPKASFEPSGGAIKFDVATKPCSECGRMTTQDAEICPGCGYSFTKTSVDVAAALKPQTAAAPQPPMMPQPVQQATPAPPVAPQPSAAQAPAAPAPQAPAQPTPAAPVLPKPVPKAPSMPGPLPRPGTVFDASPHVPAEPSKTGGRPGMPPPIPRRKTTDIPAASAPLYPEHETPAPVPRLEPRPVERIEPAAPVLPPTLGPSGDENDFTRQLFGGMGFEPVPSPVAPAAKPNVAEQEVQGSIQPLGDACRMVKSGPTGGAKSGLKSHLEVRRPDQTWVPILTYEIYEDVSLRHEFTLDGRRKTIRIDLPPQAVQELADNDLTTNWQNYCQRFLSGRTISD